MDVESDSSWRQPSSRPNESVLKDMLQHAVPQVFDKKNRECLENEHSIEQLREAAEEGFSIRDIIIIVLRLDEPKPNGYISALSFVSDETKGRVLLCNITGKYLDARLWWQDMILNDREFNAAVEEVAYFSGHSAELAVLDSDSCKSGLCCAIDGALQKKQTFLPFLIRPKNSTSGREQLIEASQFRNSESASHSGQMRRIKLQAHLREVSTLSAPSPLNQSHFPTLQGEIQDVAEVRASREGDVDATESTTESPPTPRSPGTPLPHSLQFSSAHSSEEEDKKPAHRRGTLPSRQGSRNGDSILVSAGSPPRKRRRLVITIHGDSSDDDAASEKMEMDDVVNSIADDDVSDSNDVSNMLEDEDNDALIETLKQAPVCGQLTEDGWRECCELFRHPPTKKSRLHTFRLAGLRPGIQLYNYQAYAVYWMARRLLNPIAPGCMLADEMGLGKTLEILGLICLLRGLSLAWDDVLACWKAPDEPQCQRHLPPNAGGYQQPAGCCCPSQKDSQTSAISCPCVIGSLSHRLANALRPGPWLILVPPRNISVWEKECQKMLDPNAPRMKLEYMVAHDSRNLSAAQVRALRNDTETQQGTMEQGRLIVISSPQSFYSRVIQTALIYKPISSRRSQTIYEASHPITWSCLVFDECHVAMKPGTVPTQYFQKARNFHCKTTLQATPAGKKWKKGSRPELEYPEGQVTSHPSNPLRIGVSGTPIEGSPDDIIGFVQSWANMSQWEAAGSGFEHCTTRKLRELTSSYKQVVKEIQGSEPNQETKAKIRDYVTRATAVMTSIMIKRRAVDEFFGEPIVDIPAMDVQRHECPLKPEWQHDVARLASAAEEEAVKMWNKQLQQWQEAGCTGDAPLMRPKQSDHTFYLRLCAGFPAIARLRGVEPGWKFTGDELYNSIRLNGGLQKSLYKTHLNELVESSAKISRLEAILTDLAKRSETQEKQGKRPAKALILTHSPALLAILILYFEEYRRNKTSFVAITTTMSFEARTRVVDEFCGNSNKQDNSSRSRAATADVLLSLITLMSTGYNMQGAADTVVLFGPDWMKKNQDQAFCRVHRQGQIDPTHLHLLYDPANPIERDIIGRQDARGKVMQMSWSISTESAKEGFEQERRVQRAKQSMEAECTV